VLLISLLLTTNNQAQNLALGTWRTHLPYNTAVDVCKSNNYIYCATPQSVFAVNLSDNSIKTYSKSSGLSDVGVAAIGYDTSLAVLIIVYSNANIDILQHGKVYNITAYKNAGITADKEVRQIYCHHGMAYLATGFGIVTVNLEKKEMGDSYFFIMPYGYTAANAVYADDASILAATENGLYFGDKSKNLLSFSNWNLLSSQDNLPSGNTTAFCIYQDQWTTSIANDAIYQYRESQWQKLESHTSWICTDLSAENNMVAATMQKKDVVGNVTDKKIGLQNGSLPFEYFSNPSYIQVPENITIDQNSDIWFADIYTGLNKFSNSNYSRFIPNGPYDISGSYAVANEGKMYIMGSGITRSLDPPGSRAGWYIYDNGLWENVNATNTPSVAAVTDPSVAEPLSKDKLLIGANNYGLLEVSTNDQTFLRYDKPTGASSNYRISAMVTDERGNVWIANSFSNVPIICRKVNGEYIYFSNFQINGKPLNDITIDKNGQVWMTIIDGGMAMLNYGNTLEDKSDDQYILFNNIPGLGGLPTNSTWCLSADNDGNIWVGTSEGIAIITCTEYALERQCDATQICIPRNDGTRNCDNLLEDEIITCITIDVANRKWIGTNNGVFLVSADGLNNLHYFNKDNSPLLSNVIKYIGIQPTDGEVFFITDRGVNSYRGEATFTEENASSPYAYPNPVPPDYDGLLAIRNMPNNANVNITDSGGRLVFKLTTTGGQIVWDMKDFDGNSVATGVYYFTAQGQEKKDHKTVKVLIVRR
jgi:ligand-binding sensor domain-containing protein